MGAAISVNAASVNALPAQSTPTFTVSWSGSDPGGSGIAFYNVYVSDNGGAFALWQNQTTQTSATYNGAYGHTYAFYSVATDNLGDVQPTPTAAPATTTVPALSVASTATINALQGISTGPVLLAIFTPARWLISSVRHLPSRCTPVMRPHRC